MNQYLLQTGQEMPVPLAETLEVKIASSSSKSLIFDEVAPILKGPNRAKNVKFTHDEQWRTS